MSNYPSDDAMPASPSGNSPGKSNITIELTARFDNLDRIRDFVGAHAESCGLTAKATYQVQLAVDEAFTNIIEHAYGGECEEIIECACQETNQGLVITLRDCGQIFEPRDIPEPDLDAQLEERGVGGLGLFFIRQLMDDVEFTFANDAIKGRDCNVLRMAKFKEGRA